MSCWLDKHLCSFPLAPLFLGLVLAIVQALVRELFLDQVQWFPEPASGYPHHLH